MTATGFDIAIVGGGVIGLSLARALSGEGAQVAVIDAGADIPPATNAAAGMLAPSFEHAGSGGEGTDALGEALYHLGARGLSLWPAYAAALEEETGVFVDFRGDGALGVAFEESDAKALAAQAERVAALGGAAEMISGDAARALEPGLSDEIIAALHAPNDAQVDPRRLLVALRASLERRAVKVLAGRVAAIEQDGARDALVLAGGERLHAEKIVIASGAVSGLVAPSIVFPVKGEAVAISISEGELTRVIRAPGAYLCPKAEGRLVIGASVVEGRTDLAVDPSAAERLKVNAALTFPALGGRTELERWAGLRPGTPDSAPILGRDAQSRYLALGHYRNGVLHAPAATEAMATLILGRAPAFDLAPFSMSRFGEAAYG